MEYIGLIALHLLLVRKLSPFSTRVLVIGCEKFVAPIVKALKRNGYAFRAVTSYHERIDPRDYDALVIAEYVDNRLLIGPDDSAFIPIGDIRQDAYLIHISGNVDLLKAPFAYTPERPRSFQQMSYTTDFIDPQAVIDLHTAGLKVGREMLKAKRRGLTGFKSKQFIQNERLALAFRDKRLW